MYTRTVEIWVGLFVVAGVVSLVFTAFQVSGMSDLFSRPGYAVYVEFDNIGSLRPRASVSAGGVVVGRVSEINYDTEKYQARATLSIDNDFYFPVDSQASIRTSGLLGEQYIHLEPGVEETYLTAGDSIYHSESAMVLEVLVSQILASELN